MFKYLYKKVYNVKNMKFVWRYFTLQALKL